MTATKKYLHFILAFVMLVTLVFSTQSAVLAQSPLQNENEQNTPPLLPDANWESNGIVQKTLNVQGQTITLLGESYDAFMNFPDKKPDVIIGYYSSENLALLGWKFVGGLGIDLFYINDSGNYLTVEIVNCLDSKENFCIHVWQSLDGQVVEKSFSYKIGPIGFNKTDPANGTIIAMPANTYQLLKWTDALLPETDRYEYCIDQTNNNSCDSNTWIQRDSLYSGDAEFTLQAGKTYYWQVRSRDTLIYGNGAANAWWSFSIAPSVISFNKSEPVNNTTIAMPAITYNLLKWTDALLPPADRYQYCIDTTNNNSCDGNNWIQRDSLYSGEGEFELAYGQSYYWQVRARDAGIYANSGAWWKFTVEAILPAPMVTSIVRTNPAAGSTNAASVIFTVTFSHTVTGVNATDFVITKTGTIIGESITSVNGVDGTATRTVTVNTGSGGGTIRLDFKDDDTVQNIQSAPIGGIGLNNGNFTTGQVYTIRQAPKVLTSIPSTTGTPGIITFAVTFDESVTGVNISDFALTTTGAVNGATITSVSVTSSSAVYTVTVNTGGVGAGTIRLDVIDDDTILNTAPNPLGGAGAGNGNYTIGTVFNKSTFADVPTSGSPWSAYQTAIKSIFDAGITTGCGGGNYCPASNVTRGQMAVFLLKGIYGSGYTPPAATGTVFTDVPISNPFAAWIEKFYADGITSGCGGGNYCPENNVSRAEMAVFLLRADHGAGYTPPAATGTLFLDIPLSNPFVAWIEQLANQGITSGCGSGNYCPANPVNRAQMAIFLKNVFGLP